MGGRESLIGLLYRILTQLSVKTGNLSERQRVFPVSETEFIACRKPNQMSRHQCPDRITANNHFQLNFFVNNMDISSLITKVMAIFSSLSYEINNLSL